jgi:hypothetical protein
VTIAPKLSYENPTWKENPTHPTWKENPPFDAAAHSLIARPRDDFLQSVRAGPVYEPPAPCASEIFRVGLKQETPFGG